MKKEKKYGPVSDKPDSLLAGPVPTANSEEFVPRPIDNIKITTPENSNDVYDFIPQLKTKKKYK